ncbi:aminotransferase class III-fold pyridoxal phosphate-dependent enzyme, partial [Candidatus Pacearchaeota archaeon]|nr:aminotransferase class III-fold pyridoxal phosphate-dependent enzyme [Candidatus Pacearchaeota archaeon]
LNELAERHMLIGNITGKGLFIGIELVRDRKTKEPADRENKAIQTECMRKGLLYQRGGYFGNIIKVICPLTIEKEKVDKSLEILDRAISTIE